MWSQWGVVTSPRWSLRGHIVVNHMCQTKSPSPVRQYVCMMSNNTGFAFVQWYLSWRLAGIGTLQQLQRLAFWTTQLMMKVDNPEHDFLFSFFQIKSHPSPSLQFPPALPQIIMDTPLPQYYTSPTPPHPTEQIWRDS